MIADSIAALAALSLASAAIGAILEYCAQSMRATHREIRPNASKTGNHLDGSTAHIQVTRNF